MVLVVCQPNWFHPDSTSNFPTSTSCVVYLWAVSFPSPASALCRRPQWEVFSLAGNEPKLHCTIPNFQDYSTGFIFPFFDLFF